MEIVIAKNRAITAASLIDPTDFATVKKYITNNIQGIEFAISVQEGYDLAQVASPLMVHNDNPVENDIDGMTHTNYLKKLIEERVLRMIVPDGARKLIDPTLKDYIDEVSEIDETDAYLVILLPPIYWIKSMNKKWE